MKVLKGAFFLILGYIAIGSTAIMPAIGSGRSSVPLFVLAGLGIVLTLVIEAVRVRSEAKGKNGRMLSIVAVLLFVVYFAVIVLRYIIA